jgi:23S rRNA pseudouridine2605 synthase
MGVMRIQKALAHLGLGSRRHCEQMVSDGRVSLDGEPVCIGQSVTTAELERILVDGRPVGDIPDKRYLLLNKPAGFVTTVSDPQGRPTVMDLLPEDALRGQGRVYPVGRLDRQTLGVLLFTNDGHLAHRLLHPSSGVEKEYLADVRGTVSEKQLEQLRKGPTLEDGPTQPPKTVARRGRQILMVIKEGRKRQVRRMLKEVGLYCQSLERLTFGGLDAGGLRQGEFRHLESYEVDNLRRLCRDESREK